MFYTQVDKFCELKLLHLSEGKKKLLGLETLPTLLSETDQKVSSLYHISEEILRGAFMDDDLLGTHEAQRETQKKHFDFLSSS